MKNKSKKLLALLVSGLMAVSSLTLSCSSAFAESNISNSKLETNVSSSPVTATGSIGSLIDDEMKKSEEEKSEGQQSNYAINNIKYDAEKGIIDIDYISQTNSTIFVGFYNDEGNELYTSMTKNVQASDSGHEQLIVLDALPEHYLIKVFLVGNHQNALCKAKIYDKCTKVMQEILATTTDDFVDKDRIINFDDKDKSNFAVIADKTIHIKSDPQTDTYVESDENGTYYFDNIKEIAKLKRNDVVVVTTNDENNKNDLLTFKVDGIKIDKQKATITTLDMELDEAFEFIKIETEEMKETPGIEVVDVKEGVELVEDESKPSNDLNKTTVSKKYNASLSTPSGIVNDDIKGNNDEKMDHFYKDKSLKISEGPLSATLTISSDCYFDYYIGFGYVSLDCDTTFTFRLSAQSTGSLEPFKLGKFEIPITTGVSLSITPSITVDLTGSLNLEVSHEVIFGYNPADGFTFRQEKKDPSFNAKVTIDIKYNISLSLNLLGNINKVGVDFYVGGKFIITVSETKIADTDKTVYKRHECKECLPGKGFGYFGADIYFEFLKIIKGKKTIGEMRFDIPPFYLSSENKYIPQLGECKNYSYLMNYSVTDQNGDPIKDVVITSDRNNLVDSNGKAISKVKTDDKGYAELWININDLFDETTTLTCTAPTGETDVFCIYSHYASADGKRAMDCKRTIKLEAVEDKKDTEKNTSDNGNIIESGIWGNPKKYPEVSNVHYELTSDGDLYFWGEGVIKDGKLKEKNRGSVKRIIVLSDKLKWDATRGYDKEAPGAYSISESPLYVDISRCSNEYLSKFVERKNLEEVILPNNLKYLFSMNFSDATKLKKVTFPDSLEGIGIIADNCDDDVFMRCTSLEEIEFPTNLIILGSRVFYGCTNLKTVKLNSNLKIIGYEAFRNTGITSMIIPESVKYINVHAFEDCDSLEYVKIEGDYGTEVYKEDINEKGEIVVGNYKLNTLYHGQSIFSSLPALKRVDLGEKVTRVNSFSFYDCNNLSVVNLNEGLKTIGSHAFESTAIKEITLPESVSEIESEAFSKCKNLSVVNLNEGLKKIGSRAFAGTAIKEITILNRNCDLRSDAIAKNTTIYCYTDSTAHKYALRYGNPYVLLDPQNVTTVSGNAGTTIKTTTTTTSSTTTTTAPVTTVFTYTNAVPDSEYVLIAVKDASAIKPVTIEGKEDDIKLAAANQLSLLSTDNIIYFDQQTADEKGTVTFSFVKNKDATYILTGDFGSHKVDQMISKGEPKVEDAPQKYVYESEVPMVETKTEMVMGDANGNGKVDMSDAVLIMQMLSNPSKFKISPEFMENADVYKPGTGITTMDALSIQKYLLSLIPELPEY